MVPGVVGLMLWTVGFPAVAAEVPVPTPILAFRVADWIGAGGAGSVELHNLGTAPARVALSTTGALVVDLATVEVPAGGTTTVAYHHTGTCPTGGDGWGACDEAGLVLTGTGGTFTREVEVFAPDVGRIGTAAPMAYWDPSGAPPSSPRRRSSGGLGAPPGARTPPAPAVYGVPRAVSSARARFLTQVYAGTGLDQAAADALADRLRALAARCDDARTEPRPAEATEGQLVWGADGRVSALVFEKGGAEAQACLVRGLLGTSVPPGAAGHISLHVRAAPAPGTAILAVDGTLRIQAEEAASLPVQNLGTSLLAVRVLGRPDFDVPVVPLFVHVGETRALSARYTGACPPGAAPCARTSLRVLGVNGILEIPVEVWPSSPPPGATERVYWSTAGPPATPQAVVPDTAWSGVVTAAAAACSYRAPLGGRASWAEDGRVETVVLDAGDVPGAQACLVPALFRAALPGGPGAAIFALGGATAP